MTLTPYLGEIVIYHCKASESQNNAHRVPAIVVRIWPKEYSGGYQMVNLRVLDDGETIWWRTSVKEGTEPGHWSFPAIV